MRYPTPERLRRLVCKNEGILSFSDAIDEELNEINSLKSCYPHAVACF